MKILTVLALLASALPAAAQVRYPPRPAEDEPIVDLAGLIKAEDAAEIRDLCRKIQAEKRVPIKVVTIRSLGEYGASGWPIERYAMNLLGEWGVGSADWNHGILLLVSTGDRKARIEMGNAWGRGQDAAAQGVVNERVIPWFKAGNTSRGLLEGVKGLHAVALGLSPPRAPSGPAVPAPGGGTPNAGFGCSPMLIVVIIVGIMIVGSLFRRAGSSSWGPGIGGGGFGSGLAGGCLGSMVGNMLMGGYGRHHRGGGFMGGGGWGGGSSGGGFSGGGGATGSW
jgi:uncharacterized protein